jgi:hypothetical protein
MEHSVAPDRTASSKGSSQTSSVVRTNERTDVKFCEYEAVALGGGDCADVGLPLQELRNPSTSDVPVGDCGRRGLRCTDADSVSPSKVIRLV